MVSNEGAQIDLTESKTSAVFLCVDPNEPPMMAPCRKGETYYAEYLGPVEWAKHAWYLHHDDAPFPFVVTAEEIKTFFKRFA